jgi:hypothetical protein
MGREVRKVSKDWKHPTNEQGKYIPLFPSEYNVDVEKRGPEEFMPNWPIDQRTHLMMYETCTEGTPISPAFETPEELALWLT